MNDIPLDYVQDDAVVKFQAMGNDELITARDIYQRAAKQKIIASTFLVGAGFVVACVGFVYTIASVANKVGLIPTCGGIAAVFLGNKIYQEKYQPNQTMANKADFELYKRNLPYLNKRAVRKMAAKQYGL